MIPRAVPDLSQLNDDRLFAEIASGMRLCLTNALRLWRDAKHLEKSRSQGFRIIKFLVEEEAAKFHILLNAARCPRDPRDPFTRHLKYFSDHLARGLYTEYYQWQPMDLGEAVTYIDCERQALYLDGPEGVDWIFRNAIERRREEAMYVDYVALRDHFHDEHSWHCPNPRLLSMYLHGLTPNVLHIADVLHHVGLTSAGAIRVVAQVWRHALPPETLNAGTRIERADAQPLRRTAPAPAFDAGDPVDDGEPMARATVPS